MKRSWFIILSLFIFTNVNAQWLPLGNALAGDIAKLHVYNSNLYAGGTASLFRSTDNGTTWTSHLPIPAYAWSIASAGSYIYCGIWNGGISSVSGVYRSSDNGLNWNIIGLNNNNISDIAADNQQIVAIAFVDNSIYKSTNNGLNWVNIRGSLGYGVYVTAISGNNIYVGAQGLHKTTNDGANWIPVFMSDNIESVCASGSVVFAGTYSTGLHRSSDNGLNWQQTLNISKRIKSITMFNNNVFVGVDSAFYVSTDGGFNFVENSQGIETASISSTVIKDNYIFAANSNFLSTNVAAWKRPLSQLVGINELQGTSPSSFSLSQNFPNPFNPATTINYTIPKTSFVTISVYDALGREVAALVNEEIQTGHHQVKFNAEGLSSGIYFYQIKADEFMLTKKMSVLK